jgi:hypothetical protein
MRATQSADVQLLLAATVSLECGRPGDAADQAGSAMELAEGLARDPQHSASVGEARLLLARAMVASGDAAGARYAIQGAAAALRTALTPQHPLALEAAALETTL